MARGKYKRRRIRQQRRLIQIHDSGLSTRIIHILEENGIKTLDELDSLSDDRLRAISRIGVKAMDAIHAVQLQTPARKER